MPQRKLKTHLKWSMIQEKRGSKRSRRRRRARFEPSKFSLSTLNKKTHSHRFTMPATEETFRSCSYFLSMVAISMLQVRTEWHACISQLFQETYHLSATWLKKKEWNLLSSRRLARVSRSTWRRMPVTPRSWSSSWVSTAVTLSMKTRMERTAWPWLSRIESETWHSGSSKSIGSDLSKRFQREASTTLLMRLSKASKLLPMRSCRDSKQRARTVTKCLTSVYRQILTRSLPYSICASIGSINPDWRSW